MQNGRYKGQREADVTDVWGTIGYQLPEVFDFRDKTLYEHVMRRISTSRINCETLPTIVLKHINEHHQIYGVGVIKESLHFEVVCKKHRGAPKTHCRQCRARNEAWHMARMVEAGRHLSQGLLVRRAWLPRRIRGDPRAVIEHEEWVIDTIRKENIYNARPLMTIRKLPLDNGTKRKPTDLKATSLRENQSGPPGGELAIRGQVGGKPKEGSHILLKELVGTNSHQVLRAFSTRASRLQKQRERGVALMARPGDKVARKWGPRQTEEATITVPTQKEKVVITEENINAVETCSKPGYQEKQWQKGTNHHPRLKVVLMSNCAKMPTRSTSQSAGLDIYSAQPCIVPAQNRRLVNTDLKVAMPKGSYGRIAPRSGMALEHFIDIGAGVIDADYRGVLGIILFNFGTSDYVVEEGQAIAQLITEKIWIPEVVEVEEVDLGQTERGARGFGSTKT